MNKTTHTPEMNDWRSAFRRAATLRAEGLGAPATVLAEFLYVTGDDDPFGDDPSVLELDPERTARQTFDSWAQHDWPTYDGARRIWTFDDSDVTPPAEVDFLDEGDGGRWILEDEARVRYELDLDAMTWRRMSAPSGEATTSRLRSLERVGAWPAVGSTTLVVFDGARGRHWFDESGTVTSIRRAADGE